MPPCSGGSQAPTAAGPLLLELTAAAVAPPSNRQVRLTS